MKYHFLKVRLTYFHDFIACIVWLLLPSFLVLALQKQLLVPSEVPHNILMRNVTVVNVLSCSVYKQCQPRSDCS